MLLPPRQTGHIKMEEAAAVVFRYSYRETIRILDFVNKGEHAETSSSSRDSRDTGA